MQAKSLSWRTRAIALAVSVSAMSGAVTVVGVPSANAGFLVPTVAATAACSLKLFTKPNFAGTVGAVSTAQFSVTTVTSAAGQISVTDPTDISFDLSQISDNIKSRANSIALGCSYNNGDGTTFLARPKVNGTELIHESSWNGCVTTDGRVQPNPTATKSYDSDRLSSAVANKVTDVKMEFSGPSLTHNC